MKTKQHITIALILVLVTGCIRPPSEGLEYANWRDNTESLLKEYGHRNWVVIADAAYPAQSAPGIETIVTGEEHLEVVDFVLEDISNSTHIRPVIMVDRELEFLGESEVEGIGAYKEALNGLLGDREYKSMLHEDIIHKLDEASSLVKVLILKTEITMPYTTVFIELDCGYWGSEEEAELRSKMED
ncbi:MAG: hypothetical protein K9J30_00640 [Bacteroidales bacterium]|nr:hypothetical protein [Bacteroidales bacterium]